MRWCPWVAFMAATLGCAAVGPSARADDVDAAAVDPATPADDPIADGTTSVLAPPDPEADPPGQTEVPPPDDRPPPPSAPVSPGEPVPPGASGSRGEAFPSGESVLPAEPSAGVISVAPPAPGSSGQAAEPPPHDAPHGSPESAAHAILATVLEPPESMTSPGAGLYTRPLTLLEALQRPGDPARRLWITQAYWKVSAGYAWLRWASAAVERLDLVAPGSDPHDRAVLDVAAAAARADLAEARSQLGLSQQELVDLTRLPVTDPLPWPVDRPLASPYQTHFDAIFATRLATGRTRAIARTLPARHEAIEARAAAVTAADTAQAMAEADHAKGRRPIEAVVAAHAALVNQQREFLAAVRAYNLDIAEYAMAVADLSVPDDRFVSMLIGTPITVRPATIVPSAIGAAASTPGAMVGGGAP